MKKKKLKEYEAAGMMRTTKDFIPVERFAASSMRAIIAQAQQPGQKQ